MDNKSVFIYPGRKAIDSTNGLIVHIAGSGVYSVSVDGIAVLGGGWFSPEIFDRIYNIYQSNVELIYVLSHAQNWLISRTVQDFRNPGKWITQHSLSSRFIEMLLFDTRENLCRFRLCLQKANAQLKYIYDQNEPRQEHLQALFLFSNMDFNDEIEWLEMFADIDDKEGFVYVLPVTDDKGTCYKIGKTINPKSRVKTFSVELPYPSDIRFSHLFKTCNLHRAEKVMHRYFRQIGKGLSGEWFQLVDDDIDGLNKIEAIDRFTHTIPNISNGQNFNT